MKVGHRQALIFEISNFLLVYIRKLHKNKSIDVGFIYLRTNINCSKIHQYRVIYI
ncbi:hypothetical protein NMYAN_30056 [Nitrosomonas nitrosa]|uniref:Uncharacterized protein n=1 Tax=Nitrosomonas nitrosa TaxID=52442 RepID=A0A8H8Z2P1_9PROT|nr:hypothetical protein NMYAN_30056 [Nitrosomonas nitrosa]